MVQSASSANPLLQSSIQPDSSESCATLTEPTIKPIDDAAIFFGSRTLPYQVRQVSFEGELLSYLVMTGLSRDSRAWAEPLPFHYYREQLGYYLDPIEAAAFSDMHWVHLNSPVSVFIVKADRLLFHLSARHMHTFSPQYKGDVSVTDRLIRQLSTPQLFRVHSFNPLN